MNPELNHDRNNLKIIISLTSILSLISIIFFILWGIRLSLVDTIFY